LGVITRLVDKERAAKLVGKAVEDSGLDEELAGLDSHIRPAASGKRSAPACRREPILFEKVVTAALRGRPGLPVPLGIEHTVRPLNRPPHRTRQSAAKVVGTRRERPVEFAASTNGSQKGPAPIGADTAGDA